MSVTIVLVTGQAGVSERSRKKRSRAGGTRGRGETQVDPSVRDGEAGGDCAKSMETDSHSPAQHIGLPAEAATG